MSKPALTDFQASQLAFKFSRAGSWLEEIHFHDVKPLGIELVSYNTISEHPEAWVQLCQLCYLIITGNPHPGVTTAKGRPIHGKAKRDRAFGDSVAHALREYGSKLREAARA